MDSASILKELRIDRKMTQTELAKGLGIGQSTIVGYERGISEPTLSNLIKYAIFFNVSLDYLAGRTDELGAVVMPGSELTPEERELLELYRTLGVSRKEDLMIYLRALSGANRPAAKKKA